MEKGEWGGDHGGGGENEELEHLPPSYLSVWNGDFVKGTGICDSLVQAERGV